MARLTKKQKAENEERAQRGRNIIDAYKNELGVSLKEDAPLCDLLADLMHCCAIDCEADDFDTALRLARMHFNAEVRGE